MIICRSSSAFFKRYNAQVPRRQFSARASLQAVQLAYELHKAPREPQESPIIFAHGLFGSRRNNRSISKQLARSLNRNVYVVDLRNHGDSPHDERHDYMALAEDLVGFVAEHQLGQAALIGHSMGAKAVMTVALWKPELVTHLIPVDNAPVDAALKSDFGMYIQGLRKIAETKVSKQSEADAILQEYEPSLPIRQFLLTNLVRTPGEDYHFRVPLATLANSLDHLADFPYKDPDEARYVGPTLFVRGTQSHYVADEMLPIIGRFFPRFELKSIEGGHWITSEKPQEFHDAVVDFLKRTKE